MKIKRYFSLALTTFLAIGAMGVLAWAAPRPKPATCNLAGTWSGWVDADWSNTATDPPSLAWTALQTVDSSGMSGDLQVNWVPNQDDMLGGEAGGHLTPGHGVWKQTSTGFEYTWYAYYVDNTGNTEYSIRTYGIATTDTNCETDQIWYVFEMYNGMVAPGDMTPDNPDYFDSKSGMGGETKVPMAPELSAIQ